MTAAIAAHEARPPVRVFEKHAKAGGTTAWSDGMIRIPDNHDEEAAGLVGSRNQAPTYLMSLSPGLTAPKLAEALLTAGPVMVRHLEDHTSYNFVRSRTFRTITPSIRVAGWRHAARTAPASGRS